MLLCGCCALITDFGGPGTTAPTRTQGHLPPPIFYASPSLACPTGTHLIPFPIASPPSPVSTVSFAILQGTRDETALAPGQTPFFQHRK